MITNSNYSKLVGKILPRVKEVKIITSNIYVGINYNSFNVIKPSKIFDEFLSKTTQIILNINKVEMCKVGCLHCQAKYLQNILKLTNTIEYYPNIDWNIVYDNYSKIQLVDCGAVRLSIVGKNLSLSDFEETYFVSDTAKDYSDAERVFNDTLLQAVRFKKGLFDELLSSQSINVERLSEFF